MGCFNSITTNAGGVPYLTSANVTVSETSVDIALGWMRRPIPPVGYMTIRIANGNDGYAARNHHTKRHNAPIDIV